MKRYLLALAIVAAAACGNSPTTPAVPKPIHAPLIVAFTVTPLTVASGEYAMIDWTITDAVNFEFSDNRIYLARRRTDHTDLNYTPPELTTTTVNGRPAYVYHGRYRVTATTTFTLKSWKEVTAIAERSLTVTVQ
jgi:hypothetical protein